MHIVLATDGSSNGNAGIVALAAAGPRPDVHVSVVVVRPALPLRGGGLSAPAGWQGEGDRAIAIAEGQTDRLREAGFAASAVVLEGDPATEIVRIAQERDAGLIVAGVRGQSRMQRLLVGSVSTEVARLARVPVWLTREPASLHRALVVSDNTDQSLRTVDIVQKIPPELMNEVIFLHVNPVGDAGQRIRDAFAAAGTSLQAQGAAVSFLERTGNEVESGLEAASEHNVTVIVVAASDVAIDDEPVLGTTARGLLDRATCSVLIAR